MRYIPKEFEIHHDTSSEVSFFSIVNPNLDWEQLICDAYNISHTGENEFQEWNKEYLKENDYLGLPYNDEIEILENGDLLIEYNIDFIDSFQNDNFSEIETTVDRFIDYMTKNTKYTWAFSDDMYWLNMKFLYQDIYFLEMRLREILSYIYVKEFYPELDNFHKNLKSPPKAKKDGENYENIVEESAKMGENIFFRFSFSDYRSILESKDIKLTELVDLMKSKKSFEDVKDSLFGKVIQNEKYIDFLASINDKLESIEKVRNAIMHFRKPSKKEMENYSLAKDFLWNKINNFFDEDEDEFGLEVGKKYESLENLPNFKKGNKYELKSWNGYDAIFIGEKGEEGTFFDKELLEYRIIGE